MRLIAAANYDPVGGAVSKVTTSLLAMTALDTTNLRLAVTVPSHGMVTVKMSCIHHGSTTVAQVLLGVLEGATLRGRMHGNINILQTAIATSMIRMDVSYTLTGLTPGAVNWDAAYGVEIVSSAGGAIKYGGPNDTTTNNGFGGFNFEVWDPSPYPTNFALTSIDANGRVDIIKVAGTTQTAGDIPARLPAALTADGNIKADALRLGGTSQTGRDIGASVLLSSGSGAGQLDFTSGVVKANATQLAGQTITAAAGVTFPTSVASPTNITAGTITTVTNLTNAPTAGDLTATMKASVNAEVDAALDTAVPGIPTANSINERIKTMDDADIPGRLPAALSGDGFMKADLLSIGDELTSGNNATLNLKQLNILNNGDYPVSISTSQAGGSGVFINSDGANGTGVYVFGSDNAMLAESIALDAVMMRSTSGKSIGVPDDIEFSDGTLNLAAIAAAVWAAATRTLTAISDSAGITTLLTRIAGALNISGGKVESNVKQINDTDITGDGSGTPWGPA
jgi:hypothetical protein